MSFKSRIVIVLVIIALVVFYTVIIGYEYNVDINTKTTNPSNVEITEEVTEITEHTGTTITNEEAEEGVEPTEPETEQKEEGNGSIAKDEPIFYLSDYERWVAECIVMGEAGGEPNDGQVLVAQCLLNACLKEGLQPSEVRIEYQYSGWNNNPSDGVKDAVIAVFDNGYKVTDEFILYFYAPKYASGSWHETQRFVAEVGGHRFFTEWNN
jgi:spore germination cell wall hydrolase CwlJ-like protein